MNITLKQYHTFLAFEKEGDFDYQLDRVGKAIFVDSGHKVMLMGKPIGTLQRFPIPFDVKLGELLTYQQALEQPKYRPDAMRWLNENYYIITIN